MRLIITTLLACTSLALAGDYHGHPVAHSQQYHAQDGHGSYSYGYADPNSQKHEERSHDGTTHGGYSYVDGDGHVQSVKYVADHAGFHVAGTNLPQAPQAHHHAVAAVAPVGYHSAGAYYGGGGHGLYHGPGAAIGHDGQPIETPEVQAAKAAHFAAHAEAKSAAYHGSSGGYAPAYFGGHHQQIAAYPLAHHATVLSEHGTPIETPEVQAAKHAHFLAHAQAKAQSGGYGGAIAHGHGGWRKKRSLYGLGAQSGHQTHILHGGYEGGYGGGHYHGPEAVLGPHGVPLETPEVVAAKHAHFAAHAEAKSRLYSAGHYGGGGAEEHYGAGGHGGAIGIYHAIPLAYHGGGGFAHGGGAGYHHGGAVIGPHGVPLETPEVVAAKHAHFAAHAEAKARNYAASAASHYGGEHHGW